MSASHQKYAFPESFTYFRGFDAQAIGDELEALIDERQEHVTSDEIVAAARKRNSAMHDVFTWDENEAAERWRRKEAKNLTSSLVLTKNGKATRTRGFVYIEHPEHGGKRVLLSTRSAMARPEIKEQVIEHAIKALQRSLVYWSTMYGSNPALKRTAKDVKVLRARIERQLMAAV